MLKEEMVRCHSILERMSVFAKPVKNNSSEYELSDEEREVLKKAKV
jgi:hypothetical protein